MPLLTMTSSVDVKFAAGLTVPVVGSTRSRPGGFSTETSTVPSPTGVASTGRPSPVATVTGPPLKGGRGTVSRLPWLESGRRSIPGSTPRPSTPRPLGVSCTHGVLWPVVMSKTTTWSLRWLASAIVEEDSWTMIPRLPSPAGCPAWSLPRGGARRVTGVRRACGAAAGVLPAAAFGLFSVSALECYPQRSPGGLFAAEVADLVGQVVAQRPGAATAQARHAGQVDPRVEGRAYRRVGAVLAGVVVAGLVHRGVGLLDAGQVGFEREAPEPLVEAAARAEAAR